MAGSIVGFRGSEEERFWAKVQIADNGCWLWTGAKTKGYGTFGLARKSGATKNLLVKAHRWAYEYCIGPIPEGLEPDHLCRNCACVNPWHLEPITQVQNVYRSDSISSLNAQKLFCKSGHSNWRHTIHKNGRLKRRCITCERIRERTRPRRKR